MTLPFEARNEVLFVIVGFADHPVSNVPRSQPLIFYRQKLRKRMQKKQICKRTCFLWFVVPGFRIPDSGFRIPDSGFRIPDPDSGFRIPVSDYGLRIPVPHFGFRFLGFRVAPTGTEKHEHNISRLFGQKKLELLTASWTLNGNIFFRTFLRQFRWKHDLCGLKKRTKEQTERGQSHVQVKTRFLLNN